MGDGTRVHKEIGKMYIPTFQGSFFSSPRFLGWEFFGRGAQMDVRELNGSHTRRLVFVKCPFVRRTIANGEGLNFFFHMSEYVDHFAFVIHNAFPPNSLASSLRSVSFLQRFLLRGEDRS